MPRGGKRTATVGKKLGRPKATRVVDGNIARKIKARVRAEELWVFLVHAAAKKAKETGNTHDLREALEYLDDRDLGKCVQPVDHNPQDQPMQVRVTVEHIGARASHSSSAKAK